jgi:hypothetical protein
MALSARELPVTRTRLSNDTGGRSAMRNRVPWCTMSTRITSGDRALAAEGTGWWATSARCNASFV